MCRNGESDNRVIKGGKGPQKKMEKERKRGYNSIDSDVGYVENNCIGKAVV